MLPACEQYVSESAQSADLSSMAEKVLNTYKGNITEENQTNIELETRQKISGTGREENI